MKKTILFAAFLFATFFTNTHSQTLYGTTSNSGLYGGGTIYKYDVATATKSDVFDFPIVNDREAYPVLASLCELNGKFYGTTSSTTGRFRTSSGQGQGTLFEYNPTTNTHTVLYHFGDAITGDAGLDGGQPIGSLIPLNGKLYGVTASGGIIEPYNTTRKGVIFEFNPTTNTYTKLIDINVAYGNANSPLLLATDGNFYGVSKGNGFGTYPNGVVFRYNLATNTLSIVAGFSSGATNYLKNCNNIREAANGKIYGIAEGKVSTATNNVIFECDIVANTITQKASFGSTTLLQPTNTFLYDGQNGSFYGTTANTIFEYNVGLDAISTKFTFNATSGSLYPGVGINSASGKFYGHTVGSTANPYGEIFEYNFNTNIYSVVIAYNSSGYAYGLGDIFFGSNNKAYSYCLYKPGFVAGTNLQELDFSAGTSTYKLEYNLTAYGTKPKGNLLKGSDGKLYGATTVGAAKDKGCFFSFNPATGTMVKIKDFTQLGGEDPNANFVEVAGKIYGTTKNGSTTGNTAGTLFEYDIATNTYTVKKEFPNNQTVGYNPVEGLIVGQNGKLYGQTITGLATGAGTIFEYDITANTLSIAFAFLNNTSTFNSAFVEGASGVFYGYNGKYLLKVDINTNIQASLTDFSTQYGPNVNGRGKPLVFNNAIYSLIDAYSCFAVTKYNIATSTISYNVCDAIATGPDLSGGIIKGSDNKLYFNVNTYSNSGVISHRLARVFELNPTTLATTSLCTLEASMGHYPLGSLTESNAVPLSIKRNNFVNNFKIYPNPTEGNFNIEIDENLIGAKVSIFNLLGQKIKDFSLMTTTTNQNLTKGMYFLQIEKEENKTTQKLLVN
jgi:uncharacterized repeat protein (TIGR03803 family)